ncbi:MAG TPA: hypothetical protein VHB21_08735, partial [Minicystis sp.]|nr:hypothetical protein [Minicystis sp.]
MPRNIPEKLGLLLALAAASCASDHRVSPWGTLGRLPASVYVPRPDLAGALAEIDRETAALGLAREIEIPGAFAHG